MDYIDIGGFCSLQVNIQVVYPLCSEAESKGGFWVVDGCVDTFYASSHLVIVVFVCLFVLPAIPFFRQPQPSVASCLILIRYCRIIK